MPAVLLCQQGTECVIITHFYLFLEQEMVEKYNRPSVSHRKWCKNPLRPVLWIYTVKKSQQRLSCTLISLSPILELTSQLCVTSCSLSLVVLTCKLQRETSQHG